MDIVRSLELESFILTKLTKPSVPINLVGPQVILPLWWVPASRGYPFFVRNKEALPCMRRYSWWVRHVSGGNVFFTKYRGPFGVSQLSSGGIIILRVQSTADGCRSLTTLTTPRKRSARSRGRRGSGSPCGEEYVGSLVQLWCEAAVAVGPGQRWE